MTQADLIKALQAKGYSYRRAKVLVSKTFAVIKTALRNRESVELPIGTLSVKKSPPPRKCWRLGRPVNMYPTEYRVVFKPRELGE